MVWLSIIKMGYNHSSPKFSHWYPVKRLAFGLFFFSGGIPTTIFHRLMLAMERRQRRRRWMKPDGWKLQVALVALVAAKLLGSKIIKNHQESSERNSAEFKELGKIWWKIIVGLMEFQSELGMDQYLLIPFLVGWTSIYQLFWCSPGVQGFDTLPIECGMGKRVNCKPLQVRI